MAFSYQPHIYFPRAVSPEDFTSKLTDSEPNILVTLLLYNILLPTNCYIGNSTIKCHSRSKSDNRDLTETFHQNIPSHFKVIASAF